MKINFLFLAFFISSISMQIQAQEQPVITTTIQKIGQTEIKVSVVQPKIMRVTNRNKALNYKNLWKQHVNGAAEIEFNNDVIVDKIKLKAGKYLILLFPGNDWKPKNDSMRAFPGNDWSPKDSKIKFPGNDWKPKNDSVKAFPGNDWKPSTDTLNVFPGNDWNIKDSKVKFPGNDWKPKNSKIAFPGNDWSPLNDAMDEFPGNDWLVVFYQNTNSNSKTLDKNLIAAEIMVNPEKIIQPLMNLSANFMYSNPKSIQLTLAWDKTLISIPIHLK
ncbi:DUF2911 domain-containing protein [Psychroserpens sp. SPM9]|uniref:DUF2911 domain-containing protein n=1 Tax=Psychroserpens sp. SPM9 TaxID=2975598 RepID=UPI0021A3C1CD|nr:DUF2911 domain-containing protein [Psychroserpens sp. SPM9]MDG5492273.1 DUF2911 domain-containing protein [Psychroserpens sp. SPM9]